MPKTAARKKKSRASKASSKTAGGKTIREGQMVRVSLVAANRDPDQFPEPETFP